MKQFEKNRHFFRDCMFLGNNTNLRNVQVFICEKVSQVLHQKWWRVSWLKKNTFSRSKYLVTPLNNFGSTCSAFWGIFEKCKYFVQKHKKLQKLQKLELDFLNWTFFRIRPFLFYRSIQKKTRSGTKEFSFLKRLASKTKNYEKIYKTPPLPVAKPINDQNQ